MLRIVAILVVVSAVLLGLRVVDTDGATTRKDAPRLSTPDNSDYYMSDAVVRQMDDTGQLAYRMTVAQSLHFPDESGGVGVAGSFSDRDENGALCHWGTFYQKR